MSRCKSAGLGVKRVSSPVERHRETLEALAEHGRTRLAEDAQQLLTEAQE